jgi:hypothetical protein
VIRRILSSSAAKVEVYFSLIAQFGPAMARAGVSGVRVGQVNRMATIKYGAKKLEIISGIETSPSAHYAEDGTHFIVDTDIPAQSLVSQFRAHPIERNEQ